MNWHHLYLGFKGRTSRRDFWIGLGGLVGAGILLGALPVVGSFAQLALLLPGAALTAKRLHDFSRSAWLVLVPLAPALLSLALALRASSAMNDPTAVGPAVAAAGLAAAVAVVSMAISIAFLLWVGLRQGNGESNQFGEPATRSLTA